MSGQIRKHYGKVKSTDRRCAVVFMQLPDSPEKALIIDIESLPPRFEQVMAEIIDSKEGQESGDLATYMNTRQIPETGRTVLNEFHANGWLRTEPITNIVMVPNAHNPISLVDLLQAMGRLPDAVKNTLAEHNQKFNSVVNNMNAAKEEERRRMAENLLMEANLLEQEATRKRESAYQYSPELRPMVKIGGVIDKALKPVEAKASTNEVSVDQVKEKKPRTKTTFKKPVKNVSEG
jgi:hypothetical protein